jgi:hypothetical protein
MTAGGEVSARVRLRRRRLRARGALGFGTIVLVLIAAVAQLLLPRIAASVLRGKVARYGEVRSASVSALPALQLLWGSADSVHLSAGRLKISLHQVVSLLAESRPVTDVTASARSVELVKPGFGMGAVTLTHATLEKRGEAIEMRALLTKAALRAGLPAGMRMEVLPAEGAAGPNGRGEGGVAVRASGRLFGRSASLVALLEVAEGKLLLAPVHPLLRGAGRITLFADRRLELLGVSARAERSPARGAEEPSAAAGGSEWLLSIRARLR